MASGQAGEFEIGSWQDQPPQSAQQVPAQGSYPQQRQPAAPAAQAVAQPQPKKEGKAVLWIVLIIIAILVFFGIAGQAANLPGYMIVN